MLVPLNWLADYVELPQSPAELIERLTVAGLESSGVRIFGLPKPDGLQVKPEDAGLVWERDKVVVARVTKIDKHPDADKLKLVTVEYGASEPKTVVTGAPNIAPGQSGMKVVLGLRGTQYYYTDKEGKRVVFTLEPKALRGIMNDAMCMSDYELGISEDHEGIILLDDSAPEPGTPVAELFGEIVVEFDVLPNMARCLGLMGIAREVAALTGTTVQEPLPNHPKFDEPNDVVAVEIADPKLCPRYSATVIRDVSIGQAPLSMRSRLRYAGMRPINNVVDVTNYVMLEYGQPLHAFDYDVLLKRANGKPPTIIIRPAKEGERLTTLDGVERKLGPANLVIADTAGPIALAGVMGGLDTEVTEQTKNLLLESANFDAVSIRRTARQFNLFSEASGRFSRGIHPDLVGKASERASQLLHEHAGGRVIGRATDAYPNPLPAQVIDLNRSEIERLLGMKLQDAEVSRVLAALDFKLEETLWGWKVTPPSHRVDIQVGAADLIEELARVIGYDHLPETRLAMELPPQINNRSLDLEESVRDLLASVGLNEVITYAFSSETDEAKLLPKGGTATTELAAPVVKLKNPISPERSTLRRTLLPGVMEVALTNLRNTGSVALFEIGPVFLGENGSPLPAEPRRLAILLAGANRLPAWDDPVNTKPAQFDFFDLKAVLQELCAGLHLPEPKFETALGVPYLHPAQAAKLQINGVTLGHFGQLHPRVAAEFRLVDHNPFVAELDLEALLDAVPTRYAYKPLSAYPPVLRDIALVIPEAVRVEQVEAELVAGGAGLIEAVRLFDVYRGANIPEGSKSLAFAITYRVADRQLSDKEVDKAHQKIEGRLRHVLKAQIRGKDV